MFKKMFVSDELDLALSVICLIIAFSSASLISCFYCFYRKCCHSKSDPLIPYENRNSVNGMANENFNMTPHNPHYFDPIPSAPPTAPISAAMPTIDHGFIPRAKVMPPPPSYEQSVEQLYANPQYQQQYPQSQTRF